MWKGNFAHSRIANKSLSVDFCQDLSSVRALLAKKETLEASLRTFEPEDIKNIPALKEQLNIGHQHIVSINLKINVMIKGWNSAEKKQFLIQVENQFQQIEWFSLTGLKKSFAFTSWFDDAEDSQPRVQKLRGEDVQLGGGLVSAPTNFNTDFELLSSGANLRGQQWRPLQSSVETRGPSVEPALLLRDKPCELRGALPIRLSSICTFLGLPRSANSEEWVLVLTLTTTHPALVSVLQPTSGLLYSQDKMDVVVTASFTTVSKMSHRCTK